MDEINRQDRLIGIKGSRGVGKTTFLLSYAKEFFGTDNRDCLYINLNHFFFSDRTLVDFAAEFLAQGGRTLLIDQVFKYPGWSKELRQCYDCFPDLQIVFTGSSVMRLREENPDLWGKVSSYHLEGFSFREYLNLTAGCRFRAFTLGEVVEGHAEMEKEICSAVRPAEYFRDYLHHGFYPFFLEKRNFSENLLKTMNMTLEVDVMYIRQIEQRYLPKLRRLFYLLSLGAPSALNVSRLSQTIEVSRATVMNYIHYLKEARLVNLLYTAGDEAGRKPSKVYLNNSNLMYAVNRLPVSEADVHETFLCNQLLKDNRVNTGGKGAAFRVNGMYDFRMAKGAKATQDPAVYCAPAGNGRMIPLWLFGFLY
jgi:predicted AAA+ superfamily ATPase